MIEFGFKILSAEEDAKLEPVPGYELLEDPGHPVMAADGMAIWDGYSAYLWVEAGDELEIEMLSDPPYPGWFIWLTDCLPFTEQLFPDADSIQDLATELLNEGIAPFQPFFIHLTFASGKDYWGEYWEEIGWEILDRAPLDPQEAVNRWQEWLEGQQPVTTRVLEAATTSGGPEAPESRP